MFRRVMGREGKLDFDHYFTTDMGEINRGGLLDLDLDFSKSQGGLPDLDLNFSKSRGGLPDLNLDFSKSRGGLPDLDLDPT